MHELQKRMIDEFAPKCGPGEWTIIDGGVRKGEFVKLPRTIGVAKSFDRTPTFTIRKGYKGTTKKDISLLLSTLPSGACGTAAGASLVAGRPSPSARVHAAAAATAASVIIKPTVRVFTVSLLLLAPLDGQGVSTSTRQAFTNTRQGSLRTLRIVRASAVRRPFMTTVSVLSFGVERMVG